MLRPPDFCVATSCGARALTSRPIAPGMARCVLCIAQYACRTCGNPSGKGQADCPIFATWTTPRDFDASGPGLIPALPTRRIPQVAPAPCRDPPRRAPSGPWRERRPSRVSRAPPRGGPRPTRFPPNLDRIIERPPVPPPVGVSILEPGIPVEIPIDRAPDRPRSIALPRNGHATAAPERAVVSGELAPRRTSSGAAGVASAAHHLEDHSSRVMTSFGSPESRIHESTTQVRPPTSSKTAVAWA